MGNEEESIAAVSVRSVIRLYEGPKKSGRGDQEQSAESEAKVGMRLVSVRSAFLLAGAAKDGV